MRQREVGGVVQTDSSDPDDDGTSLLPSSSALSLSLPSIRFSPHQLARPITRTYATSSSCLTKSPTCLFHVLSVPSVMDSAIVGTLMVSAERTRHRENWR